MSDVTIKVINGGLELTFQGTGTHFRRWYLMSFKSDGIETMLDERTPAQEANPQVYKALDRLADLFITK